MASDKTVLTSSTSYCSVAEFLKRVDVRTVGDLASDDTTRVEASALTTNEKVLTALEDASGEVESAALLGERYTPDDLNALTGMAQAKLQRLVADIAMALMIERRPSLKVPPPPGIERTQEWLNMMAQGERIFGFQEVAEAGHLDHEVLTKDEVEDRAGLVYQARAYFGTRVDRMG